MDDGGRAVDPVDLLQADCQVMLHLPSLAKIQGQHPIGHAVGAWFLKELKVTLTLADY